MRVEIYANLSNGPLDKFMRFLFVHSSTLCIVTYGVIKIYAVQIYATST